MVRGLPGIGSFVHRISVLTVVLVAGLVFASTPAFADSITVNRLPDSTELQGNVAVTDQDSYCDPTYDYCGWYGEASAYPVSVSNAETGGNCPSVFDASRGIWIGNTIADPNGSDSESFAFEPPASSGPIEICLYTSDHTGDTFDTSTFFAVTKARARVNLVLDSVYRCRVSVSVYVNGGNVIGGNVLWRWAQRGVQTGYDKWPLSTLNGGGSDWWVPMYHGNFTLSVKYLGDNVVNRSGWVSISSRVRRRQCG